MNLSTPLSLFLAILVIIISLATSHTPDPKLYQNVCKEAASDEQRCLKLVETNPEITSAKDYLTLCRSYLKMAIQKSVKAQTYIKSLINKYPSSEALKDCATNCYGSLVSSFKGSLAELVEDPMTANYLAKAAGDDPERCDRVLAAEKIVNDSSISTLNNEMKFLSNVAFIVTNHLF